MSQKLLHLDCSGGISGDMTLGALLDLGLSPDQLGRELGKLRTTGFQLRARRDSRSGIRGMRVQVEAPGDPGHRHFSDFARTIEASDLSSGTKERALECIRRLFKAEAKVHGKRIDTIHLHELGALDTLVDVVGTLLLLETLDVTEISCSPINVGGGTVQTEHGLLPVPAPATVLLLRGAPIFSDGPTFERTTPTGALLATSLARHFGAWPAMTLERVGYGLGSKKPKKGRPNALRAVLGTRASGTSTVLVLETTLDDMTPELAGYLAEKLQGAGALDVFMTPVQMKKNRPGVNVTVICEARLRASLSDILFNESTTLGLRVYEVEREILERHVVEVSTPFGKVGVKLGLREGKVINIAPEFEDCRRLAARRHVSLKAVQQAAIAVAQNLDPTP